MNQHYRLILALVAILSFLLPLGMVPLFDLDEGAFSEATREMYMSQNFITTYLNGELRFDKPILIYWLQYLSISMFGLTEFAFRLPSAIAGVFWALGIFWFSRKYFDEKVALLASVFMLTALQINIITKAAIADSLLNMTIAFAMFMIWLYIDKKEKVYLYLAFAFIGVGTLAKGPVAIVIPLLVTFIYFLIKKDLKQFFRMIFDLKGILLFLIIALPWYVLEYLDQGQKFIDGFILKHNVSRFNTSFENHKGSMVYYIPVLLLGFLPFTAILVKIFFRIKEIFKNDLYLFLFIWFAFVFVFFSFSGTKLPHYIIYGYTPVFILMAYYFKNINFWTIAFPLFFLLLLFFLPDIALMVQDKIKDEYVKVIIQNVSPYFGMEYKISIAVAFFVILSLIYLNLSNVYKVIIMGVTFSALVNFTIIPAYGGLAQQPIKEAGLIAKEKNYDVVMYGLNMPSFMVYSERLVEKRTPKVGDIVITKVNKLKEFEQYSTIYAKNGIYLIKVEK